jgi:hypothetical protein
MGMGIERKGDTVTDERNTGLVGISPSSRLFHACGYEGEPKFDVESYVMATHGDLRVWLAEDICIRESGKGLTTKARASQ